MFSLFISLNWILFFARFFVTRLFLFSYLIPPSLHLSFTYLQTLTTFTFVIPHPRFKNNSFILMLFRYLLYVDKYTLSEKLIPPNTQLCIYTHTHIRSLTLSYKCLLRRWLCFVIFFVSATCVWCLRFVLLCFVLTVFYFDFFSKTFIQCCRVSLNSNPKLCKFF